MTLVFTTRCNSSYYGNSNVQHSRVIVPFELTFLHQDDNANCRHRVACRPLYVSPGNLLRVPLRAAFLFATTSFLSRPRQGLVLRRPRRNIARLGTYHRFLDVLSAGIYKDIKMANGVSRRRSTSACIYTDDPLSA